MTIKITGDKQVIAALAKLREQYPEEVAKAMEDEGTDIMNESEKECPVRYGLLRASKRVSPAQRISDRERIVILGYHTDYAVYVHEILDNYHLPPTKAKFLEDPLRRREAVFLKNIIVRTKGMIE